MQGKNVIIGKINFYFNFHLTRSLQYDRLNAIRKKKGVGRGEEKAKPGEPTSRFTILWLVPSNIEMNQEVTYFSEPGKDNTVQCALKSIDAMWVQVPL